MGGRSRSRSVVCRSAALTSSSRHMLIASQSSVSGRAVSEMLCWKRPTRARYSHSTASRAPDELRSWRQRVLAFRKASSADRRVTSVARPNRVWLSEDAAMSGAKQGVAMEGSPLSPQPPPQPLA